MYNLLIYRHCDHFPNILLHIDPSLEIPTVHLSCSGLSYPRFSPLEIELALIEILKI
ncbi:MAG: hypothetical protein WC682_05125 [Parcubacteria group bacterium]